MNIRDVLELYKQHMKNKNLADSTYNQYVKELGYFISFLSDLHIESVNQIKAIHIDMFNARLIREGNKATTRSRKKSIINKYFDYCVKMEIIEKTLQTLLVVLR
ncbi:site-specific integrase [Bacillus megaterium]|nr:site-specific integrase [Priestia megaterium]